MHTVRHRVISTLMYRGATSLTNHSMRGTQDDGSLQAAFLPSGFATLLILAGSSPSYRDDATTRVWACGRRSSIADIQQRPGRNTAVEPAGVRLPGPARPTADPDTTVHRRADGYAADDENMPLSAQMNASSAFRVLEAANLSSRRPDCQVIVSGSAAAARIMGRSVAVARRTETSLSIDIMSNNTSASAEHLKSWSRSTAVSGHLGRAHETSNRRVPQERHDPDSCAHRLSVAGERAACILDDQPNTPQASDLAVHEYIGLAWYRLTSRL